MLATTAAAEAAAGAPAPLQTSELLRGGHARRSRQLKAAGSSRGWTPSAQGLRERSPVVCQRIHQGVRRGPRRTCLRCTSANQTLSHAAAAGATARSGSPGARIRGGQAPRYLLLWGLSASNSSAAASASVQVERQVLHDNPYVGGYQPSLPASSRETRTSGWRQASASDWNMDESSPGIVVTHQVTDSKGNPMSSSKERAPGRRARARIRTRASQVWGKGVDPATECKSRWGWTPCR